MEYKRKEGKKSMDVRRQKEKNFEERDVKRETGKENGVVFSHSTIQVDEMKVLE